MDEFLVLNSFLLLLKTNKNTLDALSEHIRCFLFILILFAAYIETIPSVSRMELIRIAKMQSGAIHLTITA